jgi:hypothetical protein
MGKNEPLTRQRLEEIRNNPESANPYEIQHMAAYTKSAYEAMDDQPKLHEGNHCECALHLKAILKRSMEEVPVVEQEARILRGAVTEVIQLCTSSVDVKAHSEAHRVAEMAVRRCLEAKPDIGAPQWARHKWEQELYHDVLGLDVPMALDCEFGGALDHKLGVTSDEARCYETDTPRFDWCRSCETVYRRMEENGEV